MSILIASFALSTLLVLLPSLGSSHGEEKYFPETDAAVRANLEAWHDLKFGLLMHWGPYSQ